MISIIAAIGKNRELGKDNGLLWNLPEDLKFFKDTTTGYPVVMGRKTFESIGRLLPKRENIVLTKGNLEVDGLKVFNDFDLLYDYIKNKDVFIIGGASLYNMFMPYADNLYLTLVDDEKDADVYFPEFNEENYEKEILSEHQDNGVSYKHVLYRRK